MLFVPDARLDAILSAQFDTEYTAAGREELGSDKVLE